MRIVSYDTLVGYDPPYNPNREEVEMKHQEWDKARNALNSLPMIERLVVENRLQGLSWVKIADKLDITLYMAKKHNRDGMRKLRKKLSRYSR